MYPHFTVIGTSLAGGVTTSGWIIEGGFSGGAWGIWGAAKPSKTCEFIIKLKVPKDYFSNFATWKLR